MPSESAAKSKSKSRRTVATHILLRYGGIAIAVGVVLSGCIYASESFERFLIRDPRFFTTASEPDWSACVIFISSKKVGRQTVTSY